MISTNKNEEAPEKYFVQLNKIRRQKQKIALWNSKNLPLPVLNEKNKQNIFITKTAKLGDDNYYEIDLSRITLKKSSLYLTDRELQILNLTNLNSIFLPGMHNTNVEFDINFTIYDYIETIKNRQSYILAKDDKERAEILYNSIINSPFELEDINDVVLNNLKWTLK